MPLVTAGKVVDHVLAESEDGVVRPVWNVRPKTDAEAQLVIREPQSIWLAMTVEERDRICDAFIAPTPSAERAAARLVMGAVFAAPEVYTRSATTRGMCALAVQHGWLTADRLRSILGDSGTI